MSSKTKFYKSNTFIIITGYLFLILSFYIVVFTYSGTIVLIISTVLSLTILIYVVKNNPKILSLIFSSILVLISLTCTATDLNNSAKINTEIESLVVGSLNREYRYYLPENFEAKGKKSCIIALHGFMQTASTMERLTRFNDYADTLGFMVVYPEGYKKSWNDGDDTKPAAHENINDIEFISQIITKLESKSSVQNFYLTGFSNGGFFAIDAACKLSDKIDGAAVVAAGVWQGNLQNCNEASKLNMMLILMKEDPLTKWRVFKKSTSDLVKNFGCTPRDVADTLYTNYGVTTIDYHCKKIIVREIVFENGGHVWPGGEQYLPSFLIGNAIDHPDASKLIVNFLIEKQQ